MARWLDLVTTALPLQVQRAERKKARKKARNASPSGKLDCKCPVGGSTIIIIMRRIIYMICYYLESKNDKYQCQTQLKQVRLGNKGAS
jgi:hypothetical protein